MAEKKISEFRNIRLEPADNGFVLEYSEVSEIPGGMCDRDWNDRQMVFQDGEEGIDANLDKALAKMREMYVFNKIRKGATTEVTAPSMEGSKLKVSY